MALTDSDLQALQTLIDDSLDRNHRESVEPLVNGRFDKVMTHIDGLYEQNGARRQEYEVMTHQLERLEQKVFGATPSPPTD